jgi:hypothetical protein
LSESVQGGSRLGTFSSTLGMRSEQNLYSGELAAIARALSLLPKLRFRSFVLLTSNRAAVLTLRQPRQQSGQGHVRHIYESIRTLRKNGNVMTIMWTPSSEENELLKIAKEKAREATQRGATPQTQTPRMQSTTLNVARSKLGASKSLPKKKSENIPKELTQHCQANTHDGSTTNCHGRKQACSPNSGQAWQD